MDCFLCNEEFVHIRANSWLRKVLRFFLLRQTADVGCARGEEGLFELLAHERKQQQKEKGKAEGIEYAAFPGHEVRQDHQRIGPQEYPAFAVSETVRLFSRQTRSAR